MMDRRTKPSRFCWSWRAYYPELSWVTLAAPRRDNQRRRSQAFGLPEETGLRRWMPTSRTIRLISSSCGMPCPATMLCWVGG